MRRILLVLGLLLSTLVVATPARAGGWAATYLDPVPAAFQPGTSYTIGSWLLQHGNHPYGGPEKDLKVGLRFTDGKRTLNFDAVKLKEPAHYATAVALPKGTWRVTGIQEWFAPYELGTLSVPGSFKARPLDADAKRAAADWLAGNGGTDPWGEIRPPGIGAPAVTTVAAAAVVSDPPVSGSPVFDPVVSASVADTTTAWWRSPYLGLLVLAAVGALAFLGVRRRRGQNL